MHRKRRWRASESGFSLCDSPAQLHSRVDRQASDASTSTTAPLLPATSPNNCDVNPSLWSCCHQVYIGNSHCPIDGWYQACRQRLSGCTMTC